MMLELDIGNTRVKWRCVDRGGAIQESGDWKRNAGWSGLDRISSPVTAARAVSVAGESDNRALCKEIQARWGVETRFAVSQKNQGGLQNSYDDESRMGADRWLAMLAVRAETAADALVVSCGSAVTIDLIAASGRHVGGYILPGLAMMTQALLHRTDRVRFDASVPHWKLEPGTSTCEAVHNGALLAVCSAIKSVILAQTPRPLCYLCGGDAELVASHLGEPVVLRKHLVLDGLAIALPEETEG